MSKRKARANLKAVPEAKPVALPSPASGKPTIVGFPLTVDLPTGGHYDVDGLLRELARKAFGPVLRGFSFEIGNDGRPRCRVTCIQRSDFGGEQIAAGVAKITRALVGLEVLRLKAAPEASDTPAAPTQTEAAAAETT